MANFVVQKWPKSGDYTDLILAVMVAADTFEGFSPVSPDPKHGIFFNNPTGGPLDIVFELGVNARENPLDPEGVVFADEYTMSIGAGEQKAFRLDPLTYSDVLDVMTVSIAVGAGIEAANVLFPIDANDFGTQAFEYYMERR